MLYCPQFCIRIRAIFIKDRVRNGLGRFTPLRTPSYVRETTASGSQTIRMSGVTWRRVQSLISTIPVRIAARELCSRMRWLKREKEGQRALSRNLFGGVLGRMPEVDPLKAKKRGQGHE